MEPNAYDLILSLIEGKIDEKKNEFDKNDLVLQMAEFFDKEHGIAAVLNKYGINFHTGKKNVPIKKMLKLLKN